MDRGPWWATVQGITKIIMLFAQNYWIATVSNGGGNGNPLQYSCLENPMDREAWWATVHRVVKSQTRLSNLAGRQVTVSASTINAFFTGGKDPGKNSF